MKEEIEKYDDRGNIVYYEASTGYKIWYEYDENNNCVHYRTSEGHEEWHKHDKGYMTNITQQEFKQIERIKLYLNNKKINRFEIMDI